jgi:phospholipid/cholesterol/gamma-HCH transport system substrate-binding protein
VRSDTDLPANTNAAIRQTSLLGEKFVDLRGPALEAPQGALGDGDVIPLARTGRNPEVEEVLGALSLLLNGGGLAQMRTIAQEVNLALEGREENVKSAFRQIADFMEQLDDRKGDIVNALEGLNRLSREVRRQQGSIDRALDDLPSAVLSLDRQREDLVRMLEALNELSDVGVRVIDQTKDVTIESFELLTPVLTRLVFNDVWRVAMISLVPLICLVSVLLGIAISARVNDPRTAQQIGSLMVVPLMAVAVFQFFSGRATFRWRRC